MSRFFNLESYIEYSQYTQVFGEEDNISNDKQNLLLNYKDLLYRNKDEEFLDLPVLPSCLSSQLIPINQSKLSKQQLGFFIEDNSEEEIFIIRPANAFGLSALHASYLFSPVFYYWNFAQQINQFYSFDKPLIIYNFDDFTPPQIIPLTFESHPKINYPIPIIDTRNLNDYQALKLSFKYEEKCDRILTKIAENILKQLKLDVNLKNELIKYLKKINIFKIINNQKNNNITSFLLLIYLEDKFYHHNLNTTEITNIIDQEFPMRELTNIINKNNDKYNFLVISSYELRSINPSLSTKAIIVKPDIFSFFKEIWLDAKNNNFPLYGQHLDRISFYVKGKEKNQDIEINLPEKICYQGQKEEKIYGEYFSQVDSEYKTEFQISIPSVYLPFTINGESLIDEETSQEKMFKVENQYYDEKKDNNLLIKICFILQPGKPPKLEVIDQYNRILNNFLEIPPELDNLGYISSNNIYNIRQDLSNAGKVKLLGTFLQIKQQLTQITEELTIIQPLIVTHNRGKTIINHAQNIRRLRLEINSSLPTILDYISTNNSLYIFDQVLNLYSELEEVVKKILDQLSQTNINCINQPERSHIVNLYNDILLVLGKSYRLTQSMSLNYLFEENQLTARATQIQIRNYYTVNFKEYIRNIARLGCNLSRQKKYFKLFLNNSPQEDKYFYQTEPYLWGYARILLWYINFDNSSKWLNYQHHFFSISNHCLSLDLGDNKSKDYLQNALISLIYLLTFREIDYDFVSINSSSYKLAKLLINKLKNYQIRANLVRIENNNTSLNELFAKLLDGKGSNKSIPRITID
ncbi:MAG: hypothetical protein ACXITR_11790 [Cyanobacterium sp.]